MTLPEFTQCHFFAGIGGWSLALRLAGWPEDREVWTGSCPCQPFSCGGLRKGHADERHLWPAFYKLINLGKPSAIFGEQVASKDGREWLCGVRADLEGIGYAVGAADLQESRFYRRPAQTTTAILDGIQPPTCSSSTGGALLSKCGGSGTR